MELSEKLTGVTREIGARVQVTGQKEHKFIYVIDYSNCTVDDVLKKAAAHDRIARQNIDRAKGEAYVASLPSLLAFVSSIPGTRSAVDAEKAFMGKMETSSIDEIDTKIDQLKKIKAKKKGQQSSGKTSYTIADREVLQL